METLIDLLGKTALITGASRGIGAATADLFARAGASVAVNYNRSENDAKSLVNALNARGQKAIVVKADVSVRNEVERMITMVLDTFGSIDILVNNAGIWTYGAIGDMDEETWNETIRVNLNSMYYCCRAVVPLMKTQGGGRIVNVSSTAGQRGEAFHSHYAATKGAIISFTKSLAIELAADKILVNAVAPGWVDTDMAFEALREEGNKICAKIPLGRVGTPKEIAGAILYLASDLATYITGEIVNVNGGSVLCG